ncbi:MAG: hypothetical protein J5I90_19105 [Caldilineales bacterium]|nr:hypothetical protein [Caldilineales bacterium]
MRVRLYILILLAMTLALAACGSAPGSAPTPLAQNEQAAEATSVDSAPAESAISAEARTRAEAQKLPMMHSQRFTILLAGIPWP